jgi:outer membrane lipoprotein-sorting protein
MKRTSLAILILSLLSVHAGTTQTLSEVLARYEAATGYSARQKVKTMASIGKITQMGNTIPVSILQKRPDKYRFDVHLDEGRVTQAFDGVRGWAHAPFSNDTILLEGPELAQIKESADFDGILQTYKQKGLSAQLVGKVKVGPKEAYKIQLRKLNGESMSFYLDANTYLVIKTDVSMLINGMPYGAESSFGDFRKVGGMTLPYFIQSKNGTMITEIRIDTVRVNEVMEDIYFQWRK